MIESISKIKRHRNTRKRGVAVVEFLFAAPAFFVLTFFVIEIALTWNDRHLMRLAAYRAAKSVVKTRSSQQAASGTIDPNLCWNIPGSGAPMDPQSVEVQTHARRAAAKLMATITPSVTQLLTMFGNPLASSQVFDQFITNDTVAQFGSAINSIGENRYVHAVTRVMKGLPAAWIFTELKCTNVSYPDTPTSKGTPGVEITLVYHRSAKMPYVGTIMWTLHWLQHFWKDDDGTSGMIRINPLDYGVDANFDLSSAQGIAILTTIKAKTTEMILDTASQIAALGKQSIAEKNIEFPGLPGSLTSVASSQIFGAAATSGLNEIVKQTTAWEQTLSPAQSAVNFIAGSAVNLLLSAPNELKTIPIQVTVRLPSYNQAIVNDGQPFYGQTALIGALGNDSKIGQMARKLSEVIDKVKPLPYVKEN